MFFFLSQTYNINHIYAILICSKLTLNVPIAAKVICFSRLLKCLRSVYDKQCGPRLDCSYRIGAVCSGSTLFSCILNSSVMLSNYLQQTTSADDIFRCIFFLALSGLTPHLPALALFVTSISTP